MDKNKILVNFSSYAFGNILCLAAGLISFPLFTRALTISEYGLLSLLNAALTLLTSLSKGGIQNSINRFWKAGEDNSELIEVSQTGAFICFLTITLITLPGFGFGWYGIESGKFTVSTVVACYFTIVFEIIRSIGNNVATIQKKAFLYSSLNVLYKYLRVILPFLGILLFTNRLLGVAIGFMLSSLITMLTVIAKLRFRVRLNFNKKLILTLLAFSWPLMMNEIVSLVLNYSDRFILAYFLDSAAVGMYSAAYSLSNNIEVVLITSMNMTTAPLLLDRFNKQGFDEMKILLRRCIEWYCLLGSGIIALVVAIGPDLLVFLASSKYRAATPVMLPVLLGAFLYGLYALAASTLFFQNKTTITLTLCSTATIINLLANWILVPRLGIIGAAYATLMSFFFLGIIGLLLAYRDRIPEISICLLKLLPAIIMLCVVSWISPSGLIIVILVKIVVGTVVWASASYLLFAEVRQYASDIRIYISNMLMSKFGW